MRRRVIDHIPAHEAERQLKLGSGGLRDVEFAVQLLQLVHGRADPSLREGATLSALARLTQGGYVGREDGEKLHEAYAFLRTLEHRIQLYQLRRTHVLPDDEAVAASARSLDRLLLRAGRAARQAAGATTDARCAGCTRSCSTGPLLGAVARLPRHRGAAVPGGRGGAARRPRLRRPQGGAAPPRGADQRGLPHAPTSSGRCCRCCSSGSPTSPDPDAGLFGFRRISESLGRSPWYLTMLRDEGEVAQRLAHVLGTSRYATDLLEREPAGREDAGRSRSCR